MPETLTMEATMDTSSYAGNMRRAAQAVLEVKRAQERLLEAVKIAFPVGAYVTVPRGRGELRGHVEHHGNAWSRPLDVRLRLTSTDRLTWVSVLSILPSVEDSDG